MWKASKTNFLKIGTVKSNRIKSSLQKRWSMFSFINLSRILKQFWKCSDVSF